MVNTFSQKVVLLLLFCLGFGLAHSAEGRSLAIDTNSGTVITNRAEGTYQDEGGTTYTALSPSVSVTVLAVSSLVVTPDETTPSATVGSQERITRTFRICNTGNVVDSYRITQAEVNTPASLVSLFFDNDDNGVVSDADSAVQINTSLSATVAPGACLGVLAVVDTNDSPANTNLTIRLTAQSTSTNTANGTASDMGAIVNAIGLGARLTSPDNNALPPIKTVNGLSQAVVAAGANLNYSVSFRNSGDTPARNVVFVDELSEKLEYISGSLSVDNQPQTDADDSDQGNVQGQKIAVRFPEVSPNQVVTIRFRARLTASAGSGVGIINFADLTGQNVAPTRTTNTVVVVDPFGTVFAGRGGSASPIPGARVAIQINQDENSLLSIPPGVGFPPNLQNENPFITDALGHFSFALLVEQLGSLSSPARYFVRVTAPGFSSRMIEITIHPGQAGLFVLTARSLDGQPLAQAGGFELVREDVRIEDLAAVALNIPMFEPRGLEITKSADRPRAEVGDTITYRVEIHNPTAAPVTDLTVRDRLPSSFHYAPGTGRLFLNSTVEEQVEPTTVGDELLFRITSELRPGGTARLLYRVRVGANAHPGEQDNLAVASALFPSGEREETSPARATVTVTSGVFSTRQIVIGRVFVDTNRNGKFDDEDKPLPGIRLFLNSGQSVITDSEGLYNFPSLGDGPWVISLDPISLPQRYALADGGTLAGRSWTRLLRTPLGGGALLRQNFALLPGEASEDSSSAMTAGSDPIQTRSGAQTNGPGKGNGDTSQAKPNNSKTPSLPAAETSTTFGTREFVTTEVIEPIAPGDVKVLSPTPNEVIMSPGMQFEARVALDWTVKLEVNGKTVSDKSIGTTRLDQKNKVSTFTYVGIDLRPGPNSLRVSAVGPNGSEGRRAELVVMGRGPARRVEIVPEKTEIQANGRDFTTLRLRAFDQWGGPALDDQIAMETSAGNLVRSDGTTSAPAAKSVSTLNPGGVADALSAEQVEGVITSQLIVQLVGGEATLKLIASGAPGEARLRAHTGTIEAEARVRITPESRPTILVGLAEMTFGQSVPEVNARGEEGNSRRRLSFFYSGRIWGQNQLTLAYDSQRPINRTAGRDRIFQLDPLDRVYPLFGDSSTRYEAAQSNSKLYARLDHNRSYAMFGDFEADMDDLALMGYARKLTGVKVHVENSNSDFVTVTGARPDTAFARDVFPAGGLGLLRLSHGEILPGSETVVLEVRDRRNPEVIISREPLSRSIDYNLNALTGEIFFLRYLSTFDFNLNLTQFVVTYEHRAASLSSGVYTFRGRKTFKGLGLKLGFAGVTQRQEDAGPYVLAGFDGEKSLPNRGKLSFAYARSQGEIMGSGNSFSTADGRHDGGAYLVELNQPLPFYQAAVRARYAYSSAGFFNPFGTTVTPGSRRGEVSLELKPRPSSLLHFGVVDERNHTDATDNRRLTLSAAWEQMIGDRVRLHFGYDHRSLEDAQSERTTDSNLITAGADLKVTDKLQVAIRREQNLGEADPTYPNQTTLAATYQVNQWAKVFLTQRLASAPITPIADFSGVGGGFAASGARRETAFGVETRIGKYSSMIGRYQLENGINGTDSFAVIGLQNRLPISKQLSLELGFERGFHLAGNGESFNSATIGFGFQPTKDLRTSARYEFRDRSGNGQLFALAAAGRIREGITTLARFQMSRTGFEGRNGSATEGTAALSIRPLKTDRVGLLFSFNHRSQSLAASTSSPIETRDRIDSLSTDGYYQATDRLELYGRFALRLSANGQADLPFVSTLSYLMQGRAQYRLTSRVDWAGEFRRLMQPSSGTSRSVYGTEVGFWVLPDLRFGLGYNFNSANEPAGRSVLPTRKGTYFTISSKLSNLFDLFGTSNATLSKGEEQADNSPKRLNEENKK